MSNEEKPVECQIVNRDDLTNLTNRESKLLAQKEYNKSQVKYSDTKLEPWIYHIEQYTISTLLPTDLHKKSLLDLACGDGVYTRFYYNQGVRDVTGVDVTESMIKLAKEMSVDYERIKYIVKDAIELYLDKKFDIISAIYLLNYAENRKVLNEFVKCIKRHLAPGGVFISYNNNPNQDPSTYEMTKKYGITKKGESTEEGAPVVFNFYKDNEYSCCCTNYILSDDI